MSISFPSSVPAPGNVAIKDSFDASTGLTGGGILLTSIAHKTGDKYIVDVGGVYDLGNGDVELSENDFVVCINEETQLLVKDDRTIIADEVPDDESLVGGLTVKTSLDRLVGGSLKIDPISNKSILYTHETLELEEALDATVLTDTTGTPTFSDQFDALDAWSVLLVNGITGDGIVSNGGYVLLIPYAPPKDLTIWIAMTTGIDNGIEATIAAHAGTLITTFTKVKTDIDGYDLAYATIPAGTLFDRIIFSPNAANCYLRASTGQAYYEARARLSRDGTANLALAGTAVQPNTTPAFTGVTLSEEALAPTNITDKLQVFGLASDDLLHFLNGAGVEIKIGEEQWVAPPTTNNSPGVKGTLAFANGYLYVCYATNAWSAHIGATVFDHS